MGLGMWSARRQRRAGKWAEALASYRALVRAEAPGGVAHREACAGAAAACVALGKIREAQSYYTQGFADDGVDASTGLPKLPAAEDFLAIAIVFDRSAEAAKCVKAVERGMSMESSGGKADAHGTRSKACLMAGRNARKLKDHESAIRFLRKAIDACDKSSGAFPGANGAWNVADVICELCEAHQGAASRSDSRGPAEEAIKGLLAELSAWGIPGPQTSARCTPVLARNRQSLAWLDHAYGGSEADAPAARLREALGDDPEPQSKKTAEGWHRLGLIEQSRGRPQEAEAAFLAATERDPQHAAALMALGELYSQRGATDDAMWAMRAAADADPQASKAWLKLAQMLEAMGKKGAACRIYEQAGDHPIATARLQTILAKAAVRMQAVFKGFKERKARRQATVRQAVRNYGMRAPLPNAGLARGIQGHARERASASAAEQDAGIAGKRGLLTGGASWAVNATNGTVLVAPRHVAIRGAHAASFGGGGAAEPLC